MKVKDLIKALKKEPQEATIKVKDWNEDYCSPIDIDERDLFPLAIEDD